MRTDIFLLKYKNPEVEIPCIASILHFTGEETPYDLHVIDNRLGTKNMSKLWNALLRNSIHPFMMFIDSDTRVHPGWLSNMMYVMSAYPNTGVVVPATNNCGDKRQVNPDKATGLTSLNTASGFCFLIRRQAWEDTGDFDENFVFFGQDTDWFSRMTTNTPWKLYLQPEAFVFHHGSYSVNNADNKDYNFEDDKQHALKRFYERLQERGGTL